MQIDSFETYKKIFESLAKSILIYASPVYALQTLEALERVQTQFYKRILGLPQSTPGYAVRLETGISHIALTVFKNTVNWIIKILLMNEKRFPKISLLKQVSMIKYSENNPKFNWALQVKRIFFEPIEREDLWDNLSSASLIAAKQELLNAYKDHLLRLDKLKKEKTTSLMLYGGIRLKSGCQNYLTLRLPIRLYQAIAQIRLLNLYNCRLNIEGDIYRFKENTVCHACNVNNSLFHMIKECEVFQSKRNSSLLPMNGECVDLYRILEAPDLKILSKFYMYLKHILYIYGTVIIHQLT